MKTNDYIRFMTEQFVSYVDKPREAKREEKQIKKKHKPPASYRLFGLVPFAFRQLVKKDKPE